MTVSKATRQLNSAIRRIQKSAKSLETSKRRFAQYKFLKSVYREYLACKNGGYFCALTRKLSHQIAAPQSQHFIRMLIEVSGVDTDNQTKSRWTRALEYADHKQERPDALRKHFQLSKGISGSAREAARVLPKRRMLTDCWADDYEEVDI